MKINEGGKKDEPLSRLLKEWRTDVSLPPRFQESVWRRIEDVEKAQAPNPPSVWTVMAHWIGTILPRPALAVSYMSILLAVGLTVGWAQGRLESTRVKDELGQRYVHVLNPYQTFRR